MVYVPTYALPWYGYFNDEQWEQCFSTARLLFPRMYHEIHLRYDNHSLVCLAFLIIRHDSCMYLPEFGSSGIGSAKLARVEGVQTNQRKYLTSVWCLWTNRAWVHIICINMMFIRYTTYASWFMKTMPAGEQLITIGIKLKTKFTLRHHTSKFTIIQFAPSCSTFLWLF